MRAGVAKNRNDLGENKMSEKKGDSWNPARGKCRIASNCRKGTAFLGACEERRRKDNLLPKKEANVSREAKKGGVMPPMKREVPLRLRDLYPGGRSSAGGGRDRKN